MRQASGGVPRVRTTRLAAVIGVLVILLSGLIAPPSVASEPTAVSGPVKTADLSKFQPGNIMSDVVFFNKSAMSEAQIQAFLVAKVPTCQSGYVCLKDWFDTSRTTSADAMCGPYSGGVRERASTIIYKVAQACGINPQVILATLQKEQTLVTHTWPSTSRYTIAMGQGCPDTAACDTRYYGFFNQVFGAAWQFKRYANPPGTSNYFNWYAPGKTWNVRFHPNAACGSTPVFIQNQATANLYYYTPYQPNAAALAAGYAAANNACSSYGNRNFYQFFTDWFGSTQSNIPTLTSLHTSTHVLGLDSGGTLWAYPTAKGVWGPRVSVATGMAATRTVSIGDLDGDGRRDVIGVDSAGVAWLYRGSGPLTYAAPQRLAVDWSRAVLITAAGDFDGDGVPDVFTTDSAGALWLWSGLQSGGFRAPRVVGNGWTGMNLISGGVDFSGDGIPDLIARNTAGNLFLYLGKGRGTWGSAMQIGNGWSGMSKIFSPGDFTGDGIADILARDAAGNIMLYRGSGGGRIVGAGPVGNGWQGMVDVLGAGPSAPGARVFSAGLGDLDGDGGIDVLAVPTAGQPLIYRTRSGAWAGTRAVDLPLIAGSRYVTLGDFSGDGYPDVARVDANGTLTLHSGTAEGGFGTPRVIGNGWNAVDMITGGMDFDGDRKIDVLARTPAGELRLYRGDGAGGWIGAPTTIGTGWQVMTAVVYAADFDGDRQPDLIARRNDGALILYPSNGSGGWNAPRTIGNGWSGMTALFSPGNFDGRGGPDILARTPDGRLTLYAGNGVGGWSSITVVGNGWNGMQQIG